MDALTERIGTTDELNINDFAAKDVASYGLIVQEAVANENWANAALALKNMTDRGVYPMERQINSWHEVTSKNTGGRKIDVNDESLDKALVE